MGNHDGESPRGRGSDADSLAVWSNLMRKRYFPNPVPEGFYTGDNVKHPQAGALQDYYSWTWDDALFVVLDPFLVMVIPLVTDWERVLVSVADSFQASLQSMPTWRDLVSVWLSV